MFKASNDVPTRNMTLAEYIAELPADHPIHKEYAALSGPASEEWFFRWIARGKGGHTPMKNAIDIIWHHPNNPYAVRNPWQVPAPPERGHK